MAQEPGGDSASARFSVLPLWIQQDCVDGAIEKTERLSTDVKQYQTDKVERKRENIGGVKAVTPAQLARVTEQEFRYVAETFEAYERKHVQEKVDTNFNLCGRFDVAI